MWNYNVHFINSSENLWGREKWFVVISREHRHAFHIVLLIFKRRHAKRKSLMKWRSLRNFWLSYLTLLLQSLDNSIKNSRLAHSLGGKKNGKWIRSILRSVCCCCLVHFREKQQSACLVVHTILDPLMKQSWLTIYSVMMRSKGTRQRRFHSRIK